MRTRLLLFAILLFITARTYSQDSNFYIFLCFGQSNMEGQGTIEAQDKNVDSRFKVLEAVNCSNLNRIKGKWYTAVPPLTRCYSGLSPADYFGRTMVENLPDSITVGVINVSVAGCKIELYDKDNYQTYAATQADWMKNIINEYGGNPYGRLIEMAKLAQNDGVIKGILLHQGESNTGDSQWPAKVKGVYDDLMSDLSLNPDSVPLLAGEVVHADQGGQCASHNAIIGKLPQTIANSYVISSSGCTDATDNLHFNPAGYREIGKRYAAKMLSILGYEITDPEEPEDPEEPTGTEAVYFEPECESIGTNWEAKTDAQASNGSYVIVKSGIQSLSEAASLDEGAIEIAFTVKDAGNFKLYARLNCPTADDDSYWVKVDDGAYAMCNGLATSGWQWKELGSYDLSAGEHNLTITYREDGAKMDKLCISNYSTMPEGMGEAAEKTCEIVSVNNLMTDANGYSLGQNFPNPVNGITSIDFVVPHDAFVSLKVYNILGAEVAELAGREFTKGKHTLEMSTERMLKGVYFYTFKSGYFSSTQKMVIK